MSKRTRKGPVPTREEWRNSPENPRNNPKLSPEDAQRITDEAIAGGQRSEIFEATKARRQAELNAICGSGLGKVLAPAKFDAAIRTPRCQAGAGAFGTYFVHTSGKYGVKVFRDPGDDPSIEFDVLGKAHATGANVPEPLALSGSRDPDGEMRTQTLIMSHMQGYKTIGSVYPGLNPGTIADAPLIVQVKALREFRKLHIEGVAHGDIHSGNVLVHPRSKKVAIVDFGYATDFDTARHQHHGRDGVENLMRDLENLPRFVGYDSASGIEFLDRYKGVLDNIRDKAENYYNRGGWEPYELAINRYHDVLEAEVLWDVRRTRSRFVSGADQPRIPGLTRRILTANAHQQVREAIERGVIKLGDVAKDLGVKPARLFLALKPEREARRARERQQPFGTPFAPVTTRRGQRPFTVPNSQLVASARLSDFGRRSAMSWED